MKKFVLLATLLASFGISAADLSIQTGRDQAVNRDIIVYGVGTSVAGLGVTGTIQTARDAYDAYGVSASKTFAVGPVGITPSVGAQYVTPVAGTNGYIGTVGIGASFAVAKNAALVANFNRRFDLKDGGSFTGNQVTGGLAVSF